MGQSTSAGILKSPRNLLYPALKEGIRFERNLGKKNKSAKMGEWSNGLFGCFNNFGLCVMTYFLPCVTAGKNAERNGESCIKYGIFSVLGCVGLWSMTKIRGQTRAAKGIDGTYTNDLLMIMFCGLCALIQEAQDWEGPAATSMARE